MSLQDFVIDVQTGGVGVTQRGFGTVLVLSNEVKQEYTVYNSLADVEIGADTETYKVISSIFAQDIKTTVAVVGNEVIGSEGQVKLLQDVADEDFYFITLVDNSTETINAIAEVVKGMDKFLFVTVNDVDFNNTLDLDNVAIFLHKDKDAKLGEGLAAIMSDKVGGKTAKFKTVKGCAASGLDSIEVKAALDQNINIHTERLGKTYVTEGVATNGEFIDVTLGKHYVKFRLEEDLLQYFTSHDNVDYTNAGIAQVIDVIETRMSLAVEQGIFEEYKINYKKKQEIPKAEIAGRKYNYIEVEGVLAGAIHGANIKIYMVL